MALNTFMQMEPVCAFSDLVVAVFNESLAWLHPLESRFHIVFLYLKNPARFQALQAEFPHAHIQILPNIGRESHTFAFHLTAQYDFLAPRTFFLQGNPWDHVDNIEFLSSFETQEEWLPLGKLLSCNKNGEPHHGGLPLTEMFQEFFNVQRTSFNFVVGAQFAISSERARKLPKTVYSKVVQKHTDMHLLPWIMERFWLHMFE